MIPTEGSSNGRTAAFDPAYLGSIPSPSASLFGNRLTAGQQILTLLI